MKVVFLKDVKGQGKAGDVKEVSDGYARNFLIPKGAAVLADAKALNEIEGKKASLAHKKEVEREQAIETAKKLEDVSVKIQMTGGADGRLYGSVTSKEIAEQLKAQTGIEVDKRKITLSEPIKAFGTYKTTCKLYNDIGGTITVIVEEK
ncbi:MAG: 50S ribosomal protein L9 [Clostridiales bacterium]|nr:50S ribosomal protein L9 [Clostridiales bacterium]